MRRILTVVTLAIAMVGVSTCAGQSISNDFNTNILNDYTGNVNGVGGNYSWSAGVGTGGTAGVLAPTNGDVMTYANETFNFSIVGTTMSGSLDVLYDDLFATGNSNQVGRVGFAPDLGDAFNGAATFFAGFANNPDAGNVPSWSLPSGTQSPGTDGNTDFDATLVSNQWYRIALNGSVTAVDTLDYTVSLFGLGASGTGTPTLLDDILLNKTLDLSSDTMWHAGLKTRGDRGGTVLDNHVADVMQPATFTSLTVDRDTGRVRLMNTDPDKDFTSYSISSASDSLDATQWLSIADNYDADSGEGVDPDDVWTVDSATFGLLSESTTGAATISTGQSIDLGTAWIAGPIEDLVGAMTLDSGSDLSLPVFYTGNNGNPFEVGDLDLDGDLDPDDWDIFKGGQGASLTGPTSLTYRQGDLDRDGDNDIRDFLAFKNAYIDANGQAAFDALVPEPDSFLLLVVSLVPLLAVLRRRRHRV